MNDITFTPYVREENTKSPTQDYYSIFHDYATRNYVNVPEEAEQTSDSTVFTNEDNWVVNPPPTQKQLSYNWNDNTLEGKSRNGRNYLMQKYGLTDFQAAAVIGVGRAESALNVGAENAWEKSGGNSNVKANQAGKGLIQWTGPRRSDFDKYMAENGNSYQSQLDFLAWEAQTKYPEFWKALQNSKSLDEATGYVYSMYVGANYRNVNASNWQNIVRKVEKPYLAMAKKNGWSADGVGFNKRLREATAVLQCKLGGVLKLQVGGPLGTFQEKEIPQTLFDTSLNREKLDFLNWYSRTAREAGISLDPYDKEHYYDYKSYYNDVVKPKGLAQWHSEWIKDGMHWSDKYKLPGHPTFSVESKYYEPGMSAGHWENDNYVPYPYSDSEMAARQYWAESRFKNDSTSEKGAMGAYQIMPATWDEVTSKNNITGDPYDYGTNAVVRDIIIDNLSKYPAFQGYKDPTKKALVYAAYNWGQGNVSNLLQERKAKGEDPDKLDWINGLPKQTQDYVNFVVFGKDGSNDLTNEKLLEAINNFKQ